MINIKNLTKRFGDFAAVDNISCTVKEGGIFGLVGTNGAGKSTLMHMLTGIIKQDEGTIDFDGEFVWENIEKKKTFFFVPDTLYFFNGSTPLAMAEYFKTIYPQFSLDIFFKLIYAFSLNPLQKINTFSKGMKRQVYIICAIASRCEYLFFDETFDGLDPVARQAVKSILIDEMSSRRLTPILTSHNLRELEDVCDHIGLLHKGGILFSRDIEDMRLGIHKVQCAFNTSFEKEDFPSLDVLKYEKRGNLVTLIARGEPDSILAEINKKSALFSEIIPLSLEEIFINETEVAGYDIKKLLF